MNTKLFSLGGGNYVSPEVKPLEIESEGLLCGSFGEANQAGKTLTEDENLTWDF